jgi:hypothetical protein
MDAMDATVSTSSPASYQSRVPRPVVYYEKQDSANWNIRDHIEKQIVEASFSDWAIGQFNEAVSYYDVGRYEHAAGIFLSMREVEPKTETVTWPYIEVCLRVISKPVVPEDAVMEKEMQWQWWAAATGSWNPKFLNGSQLPFIRCKYCARYISYQGHNDDNNCPRCARSYPSPSYYWDSVPGQTYIFYRRSVKENEFYQEFIRRFDVREFSDQEYRAAKDSQATRANLLQVHNLPVALLHLFALGSKLLRDLIEASHDFVGYLWRDS